MRGLPRWLPLLVALAAFAAFAASGGLEAVRVERIVANYDELHALVNANRTLAMAAFVAIHAALASLVLSPGIFVLWLAAGMLFGVVPGAALSVAGATVGGTVSFLVVRTAFAHRLARWMGDRGGRFRSALARDGFLYLLILRASPMPFSLVTLAAAAAGLHTRTFVAATLIGLLPPCLIWANVGAGLDELIEQGNTPSFSMVGDPRVLWPLTVLSAFGVISVALRHWSQRRARVAMEG